MRAVILYGKNIMKNSFFQDRTLKLNEVNALRKQIEREYLEKVRLEDEILEKMRSQLTMDKAAQYTDKLTGKLRQRTKDLVSAAAYMYLLSLSIVPIIS